MAKNSEVDEVTEKTLRSGGVLAVLYFDIHGKNKEELQPLMVDLINNRLLKTRGVVYCHGSVEAPIELGDGYSTAATVEILFKDIKALVEVSFNFAPVGINIIKPENEYIIKMPMMQSLMLDLAQISIEYSNYILSRVLNEDEYKRIQENMKSREEIGKRILGKADGSG